MGLRDAIVNSCETNLINAMTSFDTMAQQASDVLTGGIDGTLWSTAVNWSNAFKPFCNIIIGICILLELAKVASKVDMMKWEHGLRAGCKLCLAKVCIEVAPTFLHAVYNQVSIFITYLSGSGSSVSLASTVTPYISTACSMVTDLGGAIGLLCSTMILNMGIKICGLLLLVMSYGRVFEILIYLMISPIPVAFACYTGGGDGIARITMKFFKGFMAVCLSGLMMYCCIRLFGSIVTVKFVELVNASVGSATGAALVTDLSYDMILFTIVLVMAVAKCGGWAKQIMDA